MIEPMRRSGPVPVRPKSMRARICAVWPVCETKSSSQRASTTTLIPAACRRAALRIATGRNAIRFVAGRRSGTRKLPLAVGTLTNGSSWNSSTLASDCDAVANGSIQGFAPLTSGSRLLSMKSARRARIASSGRWPAGGPVRFAADPGAVVAQRGVQEPAAGRAVAVVIGRDPVERDVERPSAGDHGVELRQPVGGDHIAVLEQQLGVRARGRGPEVGIGEAQLTVRVAAGAGAGERRGPAEAGGRIRHALGKEREVVDVRVEAPERAGGPGVEGVMRDQQRVLEGDVGRVGVERAGRDLQLARRQSAGTHRLVDDRVQGVARVLREQQLDLRMQTVDRALERDQRRAQVADLGAQVGELGAEPVGEHADVAGEALEPYIQALELQ